MASFIPRILQEAMAALRLPWVRCEMMVGTVSLCQHGSASAIAKQKTLNDAMNTTLQNGLWSISQNTNNQRQGPIFISEQAFARNEDMAPQSRHTVCPAVGTFENTLSVCTTVHYKSNLFSLSLTFPLISIGDTQMGTWARLFESRLTLIYE